MQKRLSRLIFVVALMLLLPLELLADDFIDNGNGTVSDNRTGLIWQREDDGTRRTWEEALNYCENGIGNVGGFSDWRLPNIKELRSIVDSSEYDPAIDSTAFPGTHSSYYWSSTISAHYTSFAWYVNFYYGDVGYYNRGYHYYVRCVRGRQ